VRLRPLAALSAVALSAILLAGCSGGGGGDASPSASASAAADLCSSAAPSGAVSDGITVTGDFGTVPTVDFTKPIDTTDLTLQRTVQTKGTGAAIAAGDFVSYAATILDGATGSVLSQAGYTPGEILPEQISADNGGQIFGCATVGSRLTLATATGNETTPSVVYVIDVLGITPTAAWGEEQAPVAGMPTVSLGDGGAPAITIPEGQTPPTETQVATLKKGDGPVVQPGNQVLLQYTGVRWSNGETFDSTWDKGGVPTSFATNKVVAGFQKALEGQTVGSQVLVTMTPADGYGEGDINTTDLKGETLVFVIDILGTAPAATQ